MQGIAFLFIVAAFGTAPAYSQQQPPDHLTPEGSILSGGSSMLFKKYDELIVDVLADGYAKDVTLRAVVLPSFAPEYLVGLRGAYRVFYLRPNIQLWSYNPLHMLPAGSVDFSQDGSPKDVATKRQTDEIERQRSRLPANPKDVPLTRCERPLDAAVAGQISAAWRGVLLETRYAPTETLGLDGVTYHFSTRNFLAGETWSPPSDSKPGQLVALAETMVRYCDGKAEATDLAKLADTLAKRLKK